VAHEAPWIRAWRDFLGDPKMMNLSLAEEGCWWRLLLMANGKGLVKGPAGSLATLLRIGQEEAYEFISKLKKLEMVVSNGDGNIKICKWKERQFFSDHSTPRVQKHRTKLSRDETFPKRYSETVMKRPRPEETRGDQTKTRKNTNTAVEELVVCWNQNRGPMQECRGLSPKRKTVARTRLEQFPDLARWAEAIRRAAKTRFCTGQIEPTGGHKRFFGHFDWLVQPDTLLKIEEGRYDDDVETDRKRSPEELRAEFDALYAKRRSSSTEESQVPAGRRGPPEHDLD
jgi:hypothetical protein